MRQLNPISNSFSPNTERDDVLLAYKISYQPQKWKDGKEIKELEEEFKRYFGINLAISFNSGRSALIAILNALKIGNGDEVLLQAFTCAVAINPILKLGAKPVFVDIDETLNMLPENLEKKIRKKSKAVMIQHTFGNPAKIDEIKEICEKHNLFLIEDCAHSLGAKYKGKLCGTFGDAAFFSFGRDKIISSVYGGMAVSNSIEIGEKIKKFQEKLSFPKRSWILRQINHPVIFTRALPVYSFFNIGKAYLYICQRLRVISPSVYPSEKLGQTPEYFPKKIPNALAILALNQLKKLEKFNARRKEIAKIYDKQFYEIKVEKNKDSEQIYMRYPVLVKNAKEIRAKLKKQNIFLDDGWCDSVMVPKGVDLEKMNYKLGSCPRAEEVAQKIVNLPTGIRIKNKEVNRVLKLVSKLIKT